MESDTAAERRGSRRDGEEGRADIEVRAALVDERSCLDGALLGPAAMRERARKGNAAMIETVI
jgi:hypothetical protein